jgi:membrane protein
VKRPGQILVEIHIFRSFGENRIMAVSAGITFFGLLAIFPAMAAFISVYGLFADPSVIQKELSLLTGLLPGGAVEILSDQVTRIAGKGRSTLGFAFAVSFATSLWSANAGMKALIDGLNIAYGRTEKRGFISLTLVSLAFTIGAIIALLLTTGLVIIAPAEIAAIGLGGPGHALVTFGRWPAVLIMTILALAVLYRYAPTPQGRKQRWVTPGSVMASAVWLGASSAFSFYVSNFGSYNATYGSLGAAVGFMTWIWVSTMVILMGAELNGELAKGDDGRASPANAR